MGAPARRMGTKLSWKRRQGLHRRLICEQGYGAGLFSPETILKAQAAKPAPRNFSWPVAEFQTKTLPLRPFSLMRNAQMLPLLQHSDPESEYEPLRSANSSRNSRRHQRAAATSGAEPLHGRPRLTRCRDSARRRLG